MEEAGKAELEERPENHVGFSVEDVQEVLGEMTQEMLAKLQVYTLGQTAVTFYNKSLFIRNNILITSNTKREGRETENIFHSH